MIITEKPLFHPHVCIQCGKQEGEYFVDLQFQLDNHFRPLYDGSILLCSDCWPDVVNTGNRLIQEYYDGRGNDNGNGSVRSLSNESTSGLDEPAVSDSIPTEPDLQSSDDSGESVEADSESVTDDSNERDYSFRFGG